jgi:hypothetical protein
MDEIEKKNTKKDSIEKKLEDVIKRGVDLVDQL